MRSLALATATSLALASLATAATYSIGVGKSEVTGQPGIGFDPTRTVITNTGEDNHIVFQFLSGIHRVVQVSPSSPCAPAGEFDTGVVRVPAGVLQGSGPNATFNLDDNSEVLYFADIGDDYSPCYLGAVFCVNTDESSSTSCHSVIAAAKDLGKQYGVTMTPPAPGAPSVAANGTSSAAASTSASTSAPASSSSAPANAGVSRTASGSAAQESAGGSSGAAALQLQLAAGAATLVVGGVAALLL